MTRQEICPREIPDGYDLLEWMQGELLSVPIQSVVKIGLISNEHG